MKPLESESRPLSATSCSKWCTMHCDMGGKLEECCGLCHVGDGLLCSCGHPVQRRHDVPGGVRAGGRQVHGPVAAWAGRRQHQIRARPLRAQPGGLCAAVRALCRCCALPPHAVQPLNLDWRCSPAMGSLWPHKISRLPQTWLAFACAVCQHFPIDTLHRQMPARFGEVLRCRAGAC